VNTLPASLGSLATLSLFKDFLDKDEYMQKEMGVIMDVRDVARAHVLALYASPANRDKSDDYSQEARHHP